MAKTEIFQLQMNWDCATIKDVFGQNEQIFLGLLCKMISNYACKHFFLQHG